MRYLHLLFNSQLDDRSFLDPWRRCVILFVYLKQYVATLLILADIVTMGWRFLGLNGVLSLITDRLFLRSSKLGILLCIDLVVFHLTGHRINMAFTLPQMFLLQRVHWSYPLRLSTFVFFGNIMVDLRLRFFLGFVLWFSQSVWVYSSRLEDASSGRLLWFNIGFRWQGYSVRDLNFRKIWGSEPRLFWYDVTFTVYSL